MCDSAKPRILYVDDDVDACQMIGIMLSMEITYFNFTAVSSPQKALALIKNEPIALYILDYVLPGMTGVELCAHIRLTDLKTPILFFSAMARAVDKENAFTAGANEYLVKPDDLHNLTKTVRRLLEENFSGYKARTSIEA